MFQSKDLIDCLCEKIFQKIKNEKERRLSYYGIAQLYFQIDEHELAQKYISEYLIVQEDSVLAYQLLGQCCEALGQRKSAFEAYKRSFQLDGKQDHLILKICELLVDQNIDVDFSQIPYWVEKVGSENPGHPVILQLKKKLINKSDDIELKKMQSDILENPRDVNLEVKLIQYYISNQRMEDALKHAMNVESSYIYYDSLTWYESFYDLLTKMKVYKYSNSPFWVSLVAASERYVALTLAEYGNKAKKIPEVLQALFNFDQDMYEAKNKINRSSDSTISRDQMLDHMYGQLNFHLGCFLLRSTETEVTAWQETAKVCCPLFYTAIDSAIVNQKDTWYFAKNGQIAQWHKEGSYRHSQAGHIFMEYIKNNDDWLMKTMVDYTNNSWREYTYHKIFTNRCNEKLMKTSYFINYCRRGLSWDILSSKLSFDLEKFDKASKLIYPDPLHPEIIELSTSHCRFIKPSNQYIPKELVMRSDQDYEKFIESLLEKNFTIDPNDINDKDFVYAAVENGHFPIVLQLLNHGIDVNMVNPETGFNLLTIAYLNKHHKIVKILLKHNVDVNMKIHSKNELSTGQLRSYSNMHVFNRLLSLFCYENNLNEVTCLHIAVLNSDSKMVRLLMKYGARLTDDPNFYKITCIAIRKNCEDIVGIFLDHGLDMTTIGPQGKTLLRLCIRSDTKTDSTYNIVKLLLEKGGTNQIQVPGNPFIFKALKEEHYKIAQLFLDYQANVEYISKYKETLLHKALQADMNVDFIKTLLKLNSAAIDTADNFGVTPLLAVCSFTYANQLPNVKALLEYHPNINCADEDMWTPLHFAVDDHNLELIRILLEKGADTNIRDTHGRTPLHILCYTQNDETPKIIQLLLQYNAHIEAVDEDGWTPLFVASRFGNDAAVECLLDSDANLNHTDLKNLTPLFIAAQYSTTPLEVISKLLDYKIKVYCVDKLGNSELHLIVNNFQDELVKRFANTEIDFNMINKEGNTPLHIAVEKSFLDMTKNLIKYGSDINILDKNNKTPLQRAANIISFPVDVSNNLTRLRYWRNQRAIINILKKQVVKLKTAGLKVHQENLNITYHYKDDITDYFVHFEEDNSDDEDFNDADLVCNVPELEVNCEQEIELMKIESISSTGMTENITFLDLLRKSVDYLSRFVKNEKVQTTLKLEIYDDIFPLYIDIIRIRFRDAEFRYELMNTAIKYFRKNINPYLPDSCINQLLSYLNTEELKIFVGANILLNV